MYGVLWTLNRLSSRTGEPVLWALNRLCIRTGETVLWVLNRLSGDPFDLTNSNFQARISPQWLSELKRLCGRVFPD